MKEMKYFRPYESMSRLQMSECMIFNMSMLLLAHFFLLVDLFSLIEVHTNIKISKIQSTKYSIIY